MLHSPTYILDFDSTLIQVESLDELARLALADRGDATEVLARLEAVTEQGMTGQLPFDTSLEQRLQLFQANRRHVTDLTAQLLQQLSPSATKNIAWFQQNREHIFVISGGFEDYMIPVLAPLGILPMHIFGNRFMYNADGDIIGYDRASRLCRARGKAAQVASLSLPRPIIVIGDGYTDYEIRQANEADEFWAFTESSTRPNVVALADKVLTSFADL